MKIDRSQDRSMSAAPESSFTGDVRIGGYFKREGPSRLAGAVVRFPPSSRTPWKVNPIGQTLVILSGEGVVQFDGQDPIKVSAGDVVWCAPGERHWEGASPKQSLHYFAFQEEDAGQTVSFGNAIGDEEYASAAG